MGATEPVLRTTRRGFTFTWHGGEYIEISGHGAGAFEVINTTRADGTRPEFTLAAFEAELTDVDYKELRHTAREASYVGPPSPPRAPADPARAARLARYKDRNGLSG